MPATIDRHFRFTEEMDDLLAKLCAHHDRDRTAMIRVLLREAARDDGLVPGWTPRKKSRKKSEQGA